MEACVDRTPHPVGVAVAEPEREYLSYRVVPGLVIAGDHSHRAVPAPVEGLAGLGRECLEPAPVQDLQDVVGEGPQQRPVVPVSVAPAQCALQLVVEPDEVGHQRLEDYPPKPVAQPLVLLMQAVDD